MNRKSGPFCNPNALGQRKSVGSVGKANPFMPRTGLSSVRKSSIPVHVRRSASSESVCPPSTGAVSKFSSRLSQCNNHQRKRSSSLSGLRSSTESAGRFSYAPEQRLVKDPRPLSDKNYQNKCVQRLLEYLIGHGLAISAKDLRTPNAKYFTTVFEFFFRKLQPKFTVKKLEDDVPTYMKMIGYPFSISKATLQSIGSRHSFPAVIGILVWLLDVSIYIDNLNILEYAFRGDDFDSSENYFFQIFQRCLQTYSRSQEDPDDDDDKEFLEQLARSTFGDTEQLQAYEQEKESLMKQIEAVNSEYEQLQLEIADVNSLKQFIEDLKEYNIDMQRRIELKRTELRESKQEFQKLKEEELALEQEANRLAKMYEHQQFGLGDVKLLTVRKQQFKDVIEKEKQMCEELGKERWDLEMNYVNTCSKVDSECEKFNAHYQELRHGNGCTSVPSSIKRELEVLRASLPEFKVCPKLEPAQYHRWKNEIQPALSHYENSLQDLVAKTKDYILIEEQQKRKLEAEAEYMEAEMKQLDDEIANGIKAAEKNKKELLLEFAEKQVEYSKLKQEITELDQKLVLQQLDYESRKTVLQKEFNALKLRAKEEEAGLVELKKLCEEGVKEMTKMHENFKAHIMNRMKTLTETLKDNFSEK